MYGIQILDSSSRTSNRTHITEQPALTNITEQPALALRQTCHYHVGQYGRDGIGHQMEGKLSCWATALALNWTYVHQPVDHLEHGEDPQNMESLFGLSDSISKLLQNNNDNDSADNAAVIYNHSYMQSKPRNPLPFLGHCNEESWFDQKLRQNISECTTNNSIIEVYTADNCWDFFWCHLEKIPSVWHDTIVPTLRQTILEGIQHKSDMSPSFSSFRSAGILKVAMHMRMGDAGDRKANFDWCRGVVLHLFRATAQNKDGHSSSTQIKKLHVMIHSDAESEFIKQELNLVDSDIWHIDILGRNNANATIERFLYDMLTCQILIASDSSLSMAVALLRRVHNNDRNGVTVLHPELTDRPRMLRLGWEMIRPDSEQLQHPYLPSPWQRCTVPPPSDVHAGCQKWETVDESFWNNLVFNLMAAGVEHDA